MAGPVRHALGTLAAGVRELLAVRWVKVLAVLLLLLVAARVALGTLVSLAVNRLAEPRGLAVTWDDLDVELFSGRGAVYQLQVRPRPPVGEASTTEPEPALLELEYAVFDLDILPLFAGRLRIRRAEVDGLDAQVERAANGSWNLERHVKIAEVLALLESGEPDTADPEQAEVRPLGLGVPLSVQALRLQHARLHVVDRAVEPPLDLTLETNARLSYLDHDSGDGEHPTRFSLSLLGGELLDGAVLEGRLIWRENDPEDAVSGPDGLRIELSAQAGSLRPRLLASYLAPLDVRPASETLEVALKAVIDLERVGPNLDELRVGVDLADVRLVADGVEALALDRMELRVASLSERGVELGPLVLDGVRGSVSIEAAESVRLAGFDLLPASGGAVREAERPPPWSDVLFDTLELWRPERLPRWASLLAGRDPEALAWSLAGVTVTNGAFHLADRRVEPAGEVPLLLERFELGPVVHDPDRTPEPTSVSARLSATGVARALTVEGRLLPFAPARSIDLEFRAGGIELNSFAGYFERAGLEEKLEEASFEARLVGEGNTDERGRTEGWIELQEVALRDGGELFGVRKLAARGLVLDPAGPLLELGEIAIEGPKLSFARDASNHLVAFGLRTIGLTGYGGFGGPEGTAASGGEAAPAPGPAGREPGATRAPGTAPSTRPPLTIRVGRFAWTDSDFAFVDEATEPPTRLDVEELGFVLEELFLGGDPDGPAHPPARFEARIVAPGLLEEFSLVGAVHSRPGSIDLRGELQLTGTGIRGELLAPYLVPFGIEPTLANGSASLGVDVTIKEEDGWRAGLHLSDGRLADGDTVIASLGELVAQDLEYGAGGSSLAQIGSLVIAEPYLALRRDADGALRAGGLRRPAPESKAESSSAADDAPARELALPVLPAVAVLAAELRAARIAWSDATFDPPFELELHVAGESQNLNTSGAPGEFQAHVSVPGTIDDLNLTGELELGAERVGLRAVVRGSGLRAGVLARLLPPGLAVEAQHGRLEADLDAEVTPAAGGGLAARFEATDVLWTEESAAGTQVEPWLAAQQFVLEVERFDLAAEHLALGELRSRGLEVGARLDVTGKLHALGLVIGQVAADEPAVAATPPAEASSAAAVGKVPFTTIELARGADLELRRLTFVHEGLGSSARPLELAGRLTLDGPRTLLAGREDPTPLDWQLVGSVAGLIGEARVVGTANPFAAEPSFTARLDATGVRTAGLIELVPALAEFAEGEIEHGTFAGALAATLFVQRARPTEIGIGRPFGAELRLADLAFREAPGGRLWIGLDGLVADVKRVDLQRGSVQVEELELRSPRALIVRDAEALHASGLRIPLARPEDVVAAKADEPGAPGAAGSTSSTSAAPAEVSSTAAPGGELRVDALLASGLDFQFHDHSVEPPVIVHLDQLDAELGRFTTRAFTEPRAIGFSAYVGAADEGDGPLFEELAVAGRVSMFPSLNGWAQMTLGGLELTRFAPLALQQGLRVDDGALDVGTRLRLRGERGARVDTTLVFTDLELTEEENGPLRSALGLSVPLKTALFLLRNPDGEHKLSVGFKLDEHGISRGEMVRAATAAAASVVAKAVAAVPFRLLGGLFGGGGGDAPEPALVWSVGYATGSTELAATERAALDQARKRLIVERKATLVLRAELSAADLAHAAELANPSRAACLEMVAGLRQRRSELTRRSRELAIEARTLYAVGAPEAQAATHELHELATEFDGVERSLDHVLGVLRSDSPRQHEKRARSAARRIAELRLEAARAYLAQGLQPDAAERLDIRAPRGEALGQADGRVVVELR